MNFLKYLSLDEAKVNFKETKFYRSPSIWRLETEAGRIHNRYDREGHARVRQVSAACAAVILKLDLEEVLVDDVTRVRCWLDTRNHEHVLRGELYLNTTFFLEFVNLVPDLTQVDQHFSLETAFTKVGAGPLIVRKLLDVSMLVVAKTASSDCASLFNVELDPGDSERAFRIVDMDHGFGDLLGCVDILLVVGPHCRSTLVNTAPGRDLRLLHLLLIHLECYWGLSDGENLLELHLFVLVHSVHSGLHVVLYLRLGSLTNSCIFKVD